jgi:hypothetical protein
MSNKELVMVAMTKPVMATMPAFPSLSAYSEGKVGWRLVAPAVLNTHESVRGLWVTESERCCLAPDSSISMFSFLSLDILKIVVGL